MNVLTLANGGGGIIPMCARASAATQVHAIERNRFLYRMAKQCVRSNAAVNFAESTPPPPPIHLIDQKLELCRADGAEGGKRSSSKVVKNDADADEEEVSEEDAVSAAADGETARETVMSSPADVILTDLMDHAGGLGLGLLPAIDHAGAHLAHPTSVVVPSRLRVMAVLIELRMDGVSGFDLRSLNAYRWHPQAAKIDLEGEPHRVLSAPFEVTDLNLTQRLRAAATKAAEEAEEKGGSENSGNNKSSSSGGGGGSGGGAADWEQDVTLTIPATAEGAWNAIAFWFEADMGGGDILRSCPPPPWNNPTPTDTPSAASSAFTFASGGRSTTGTAGAAGAAKDTNRYFDANSWGTAVQYLDELYVDEGESVEVCVRRDATQIFFASSPPPTRPRHANIPQWHYDMLNDAGRNDAYNSAIAAAVTRRKGKGPGRRVDVLDAGSGSGLLSMMSRRAGADHVTACEQATHMTDAGEETVCMNGYGGDILCLNRDVRRVFTQESDGLVRGGLKPDGTQVEMERPADIMVYEVFDSGLIGEGVLHILAAARRRLLAGDATLVPCRAMVYAQPVEMRVGTVRCGPDPGGGGGGDSDCASSNPGGPNGGEVGDGEVGGGDSDACPAFDMSQANRWRWRPDYEGVNLEKCRDKWRALGDPVEVFEFDFYDVCAEELRPAAANLDVKVNAEGVFNAVVFWFELHLVGLYKLNPVDPELESAWFQPLNL
jgi:predicted RNA methylase